MRTVKNNRSAGEKASEKAATRKASKTTRKGGFLATARRIYFKEGGVRGLYCGLTAQMGRQIVYTGTRFIFYEEMRIQVKK